MTTTTRAHSQDLRRRPPMLRRTSAYRTVTFTPEGRAVARRMMMPTHDAEMQYYFTSHNGVVTHHFMTSEGHFRIEGGPCPPIVDVFHNR